MPQQAIKAGAGRGAARGHQPQCIASNRLLVQAVGLEAVGNGEGNMGRAQREGHKGSSNSRRHKRDVVDT